MIFANQIHLLPRMKTQNCFAAFLAIAFASGVQAQPIPNISTGADLAFNPPPGLTTLVAGRFNFTTINIPVGALIQFTKSPDNSPVYFLAQGDVTIAGNIDVNGDGGTALRGGLGGPGGFDGGNPGIAGSGPGDGLGPGAGQGGTADGSIAGGNAAYGTAPTASPSPRDGQVYGTQLLIPLVGGSGGGGSGPVNNQPGTGIGGGGGGGAILIASSTRITHTGRITAGGAWNGGRGTGSGGAIRLLAPVISGAGILEVWGWTTGYGHGRVRCDMVDRSNFNLSIQPPPPQAPQTVDQFLPLVFPPNLPSLRLVSVAGQAVPAGSASGFTITLPLNAPASQLVVIKATGFGVDAPVAVKLTPLSGNAAAAFEGVIPDGAQIPITAQFPPNVPVTVNVWTR